jgi:hypothetical protein
VWPLAGIFHMYPTESNPAARMIRSRHVDHLCGT